MVEVASSGGDSPRVPTIAELLLEHRRLTGDSYEAMSRSVDNAITAARLHKLATEPPRSFPREAETIQLLSSILQVPVATTVLAFAAALGLPVSQTGSILSITLPPGTDSLQPEDVKAVRAVIGQLVQARNAVVHHTTGSGKTESVVTALRARDGDDDLARPPMPDMSQVAARHGESEGRRRAEEQDRDAENP